MAKMEFTTEETRHAYVARHPGSHSDLGPFLNVITWILLVTSTLAVLTRLITKRALKRRIDIDDAFVAAALVGFLFPCFDTFVRTGGEKKLMRNSLLA